jgi:predicted Zn finger-like uncharacterized protein
MIVCPHCATSYQVDTASLGPDGRSVRCVRCKTVWFAAADKPASAAKQHTEKLVSELVSAADSIATPMPQETPAVVEIEAIAEAPVIDVAPAMAEDAPYAPEPPIEPLAAESYPQTEHIAEEIASPPIAPIEQLAALPTALPDPNADDDGEKFAVRRERLHARRKQQRVASLPLVILVLAAVLAGLVGGRKTVVKHAPQTASLYAMIGLPVNLRGLAFDSVKTSRDTHDGIPVLVVEGTIGSKSSAMVEVPRLRFAVRNAAGSELYSWTAMPSRTALAPGEQLAFKSRLASPPADAQDVTVRFFTRHDVLAGVR